MIYESVIGEEDVFKEIFSRLVLEGKFVSPRGQRVLEVENFQYVLKPYQRFQSFNCRKFNLNYVKDELLWYLKGERYDVSIAEKAKIWKEIINKDGSINSNYGQYIFPPRVFGGGQFDNVIKTLTDDKDSRRASMMILNRDHLLSVTKDVPCTYALNFRIRAGMRCPNQLNMTVHMRSQDAVFGMGNDAPAFSFIHEMVLMALREKYPDLQYGDYCHFADSFHVYERHFKMIQTITGYAIDGDHLEASEMQDSSFTKIECPKISGPEEVRLLRRIATNMDEEQWFGPDFQFTKWLLARDPK